MKKVIRAASRHFSDQGWLKTFWLFSFSDYYDPENVSFGNLRVFNDDVIAPHTGFPHHRHEDMEILTVVHSGELTHEDDLGNKRVIKSGWCQRMSAGEGIIHSEFNFTDEPVTLFQIWFMPDSTYRSGYEEKRIEAVENQLAVLASKYQESGALLLNADAKVSILKAKKNFAIQIPQEAGRGTFLYVKEGKFKANGEELGSGDQYRSDEGDIELEALEDGMLAVIDAKM